MGGYLLRGVGSLAFLIAVNFIGRPLGYGIPINLITVLLPSILGLPGLALVSLLQFLL